MSIQLVFKTSTVSNSRLKTNSSRGCLINQSVKRDIICSDTCQNPAIRDTQVHKSRPMFPFFVVVENMHLARNDANGTGGRKIPIVLKKVKSLMRCVYQGQVGA